MASRAVSLWRGAGVEAGRPRPEPRGPRFRPALAALPEIDATPAEASGALKCRSILVGLLRPFGPAASVWADDLVDEFGSIAAVLAAGPAAQARILGAGNPAIAASRHGPRGDAARAAQGSGREPDPGQLRGAARLSLRRHGASAGRAAPGAVPQFEEPAAARRGDGRGHDQRDPGLSRARSCAARSRSAPPPSSWCTTIPRATPSPAAGDIEATRRIVEAGRPFEIRIHDHVIIARSGWSSFRALGLI